MGMSNQPSAQLSRCRPRLDSEPPRQRGMHFHRIEEGPTANLEVWEVAACLPLPERADRRPGFLVRE